MDNNEYIDQMRKSSNIVREIYKITPIQKDKQYKDEVEKNEENKEKTEFKPIMNNAIDHMNQIGSLEKQRAYITSRQFNQDFHLEEVEEKLARKK